MKEFKKKYNDDFYTGSIIRILEDCSARAMAKAQVDRSGEGRARDGRPDR